MGEFFKPILGFTDPQEPVFWLMGEFCFAVMNLTDESPMSRCLMCIVHDVSRVGHITNANGHGLLFPIPKISVLAFARER